MRDAKMIVEKSLSSFLSDYFSQVGFIKTKYTSPSEEEIRKHKAKYYEAMEILWELFRQEHKKFNDADFTRIYRFMRDTGTVDLDEPKFEELYIRFSKFIYEEVDWRIY